jgi:hypothetical protein
VRYFFALIAACAGPAMAAGFQVQGNMSEAWNKGSLIIQATQPGTKLWFTMPEHSGITVVAKPDTGPTVTTRLNMASTIDLRVPSSYAIVVTRDSGEGQWTCRDAIGKPVLLGFGTSVDVKRHARVTYVADDDKEVWIFDSPKDATFLVQEINASGKAIQEQDLSDNNKLELYGGGTLTFEVVPTDGSGVFTAKKSQ